MITKNAVISSARAQYRGAFRQMATGGNWHLFATPVGVILCQEKVGATCLVNNVHARTEEQMSMALGHAIGSKTPNEWVAA
jgi:hypothetical protein